jgi:hypothetical protein
MEIDRVGLEASESTEIRPVLLPPVAGANIVPKVKLCPGLKVRGRLNPVILKPLPETVAWVTLTGEPPVLVRVSERVLLLPTGMLGKSRLESLVLSAPPGVVVVAATATPVTGTFTTEFEASVVVTETVPLAVPADWGVNVTVKDFLCPGDKVVGKLMPLILKPRPLTVACFTVTLDVLELTKATD